MGEERKCGGKFLVQGSVQPRIDPQPRNDPHSEMIPTRNDPNPEMIPVFFHADPEMIPK